MTKLHSFFVGIFCALLLSAIFSWAEYELSLDTQKDFAVEDFQADDSELPGTLQKKRNYFGSYMLNGPRLEEKGTRSLLSLGKLNPKKLGKSRPEIDKNVPVPNEAKWYFERAEVLVKESNWEMAFQEIERALKFQPYNPYLLHRAAALSALAKKYSIADDYFRSCLEIDPNNMQFLAAWAGVLVHLQRYEEAHIKIQRVLQADPQNLIARYHLAVLKIIEGDLEHLAHRWGKLNMQQINMIAQWLNNDQEEWREILGEPGFIFLCDSLMGWGTYEHLEEISKLLYDISGDLKSNNWQAASRKLNKVCRFRPHSFWPYVYLAQSYYELGDIDLAIIVLKNQILRYPSETMLRHNIGYILIKNEKYNKAAIFLENTRKLDPENSDLIFMHACALAGNDEMDKSFAALNEWVDLLPANFVHLLEGDELYLLAIKNDSRFPELAKKYSSLVAEKKKEKKKKEEDDQVSIESLFQ